MALQAAAATDTTPSAPAPSQGSGQQGRSLVEFIGVSKTYDGRSLAVKSLSLEIREGELLTLLGPSGSGKTTTLMMLAGFERPTSGAIFFAGRDLSSQRIHRRGIGIVFQDYALFPHLTVAGNVGYPLKVRKVSSAERQRAVRDMLDMVQLSELADRFPRQLSGGQQQRVALARALVFSPRLVLMDEPLGALDKQLRERMQLEIKHIQQRLGVTVLYVTHDQSEALTMSDRIAVFNDGKIEQIEAPSSLYERPATSFVAGFIGENNKLTGHVVDLTNDIATVQVDGGLVVRAFGTSGIGVGDSVMVSVRPERVRLAHARPGTENALRARVEEIIYLGSHVKIRTRLSDAELEITALVHAESAETLPAPGVITDLSWRALDARTLPVP